MYGEREYVCTFRYYYLVACRVSDENEVLVLALTRNEVSLWCSGHIVPICTLHHNDTSLTCCYDLCCSCY